MNDNNHINVSHEVLVWARESLALNRAQASESTGISPKRLVQLESGEKQPTLEELKAFSKTYKRTIATLLLNKPPKEKPFPADRRSIDSKELGCFHEKTIQQQVQKEWLLKDLVELGKHFHVGPLAILRSLFEQKLTTIAFYKEKHNQWNKSQFGRAKNPEGRNLAKEAVQEKGKTYIGLAFKAFDQNRINIKDLSDFLGVKLSYIPKTRQFLNA